MKFYNREDSGAELSAIFEAGADQAAFNGGAKIGLWHQATPFLNDQKVGTIGACEIDDSNTSVELLAEAAEYLYNQHECEVIIGPMNGNTWEKHRLQVGSDGRQPFLFEPEEPDFTEEIFQQAGFDRLCHYSSSWIDLTEDLPDYSKLYQRIADRNYRIRPIRMERFADELRQLYEVSLASFADNYLYTPIGYERFTAMYLKVQDFIDPQFVLVAESDGEIVGFAFCLPDLSSKRSLIVKTLATAPSHRSSGLGTALVGKVQEAAKQAGFVNSIHALQFETNSSLRISKRFNSKVFRRYSLMVKAFRGMKVRQGQ